MYGADAYRLSLCPIFLGLLDLTIPESVTFGDGAVFFYSVLSCLIVNSSNMGCQFVLLHLIFPACLIEATKT